MDCTCGTKLGTCTHEDGQALVTWRDKDGGMHVNGTGVVIEEMTPDRTGSRWTGKVHEVGAPGWSVVDLD